MEKKTITQEMISALNEALPQCALSQHPRLAGKSAINVIYVTERLNNVFGVGEWTTSVEMADKTKFIQKTKNGDKEKTMVVVKLTLDIPAYGVHYECYGGNDNDDLGDAYKGATTDAITKIGSWLGIGAHVWKNDPNGVKTTPKPKQTDNPESIAREYLMKNDKAREWYCDKSKVSSIDELDLSKVYEHLKSINKI